MKLALQTMHDDEYYHVKTLIRELHAPPKNVSRPPTPAGTPEENSSLLESSEQTTPITEFTNQSKHQSNKNNETTQQYNPSNLPIPSLVVTGADQHEQEHPYNSGQRRFSQFYFGLRRFSNSHTVFSKVKKN